MSSTGTVTHFLLGDVVKGEPLFRSYTPEEKRAQAKIEIDRLHQAASYLRAMSPHYFSLEGAASLSRNAGGALLHIIQAIGFLHPYVGKEPFEVFTRRYTRETDDDDSESFNSFADAMAFVKRTTLARGAMRVWINSIEIKRHEY